MAQYNFLWLYKAICIIGNYFYRNYFILYFNYFKRWIWGKVGCIFAGYVVYFAGCMQIYIMCAISYIRYFILDNPSHAIEIKNKLITKSVLVCSILSFFWSTAPIFGWSYYSLEDGLVSCSVEYNEKSFNVISYNIGMFIFVFIIPFGITIASNFKSLTSVSLFIIRFVKPLIMFHNLRLKKKEELRIILKIRNS